MPLQLLKVKDHLDDRTRQIAAGLGIFNVILNGFIEYSDCLPFTTWQKHLDEEKLLVIFLCTISFLSQIVGGAGLALQFPLCLQAHLATVWLLVLVPYLTYTRTVLHNQVLLAMFLYHQLLAVLLTLLYCVRKEDVQQAVERLKTFIGCSQDNDDHHQHRTFPLVVNFRHHNTEAAFCEICNQSAC